MPRVAVDASQNLAAAAPRLAAAGVSTVGRYYNYGSGPKVLTRQEAAALIANQIAIWVVFENINNAPRFFSAASGRQDAARALQCAHELVGQPEGSAIYFAADYDERGAAYSSNIVPYFTAVRDVFTRPDGTMPFRIGVYSDGLVCERLLQDRLVTETWLSCSRSFARRAEFMASGHWSISQTCGVPAIAGVDVDDDVLNPQHQDCGQFSTLVPLVAAHTAALAGAMLPQFLAAANSADAVGVPATGAAGSPDRIIAVAKNEWDFFGNQTYDERGHLSHAGHTEAEEGWAQRIGTYWLAGTGTHGIDGTDRDQPWSAAFISWVMVTAGLAGRFRTSTMHSVYIFQAIRDTLAKRQSGVYWGWRLNERQPQPGDLVCWSRQAGVDYDHQGTGSYSGHCDIVTDVANGQVFIIGGNVGDSVSQRVLPLNADGYLDPVTAGSENLFAIMGNRVADIPGG